MEYLLLILGFLMLFAGSEILIIGSVALSIRYNISKIFIGTLIIGFGSSTPELVVSIQAAMNEAAEIAIGNVIGSNIFILTVILPICYIISMDDSNKKSFVNLFLILNVINLAVYYLMYDKNDLSRFDGLVLLIIFAAYMIYSFRSNQAPSDNNQDIESENLSIYVSLLMSISGLILIIYGSENFVNAAIAIARSFQVSEATIGLTIVHAEKLFRGYISIGI